MRLENYLTENSGPQGGDSHHDSFVRFLSTEEVLKSLGILPPYRIIALEVEISPPGKRCDLAVLNHELTLIEAKVIRSKKPKTKISRINGINSQLSADYSYFKRGNFMEKIRLVGAYKMLDESHFYFYDLVLDKKDIFISETSQVPCL